MPRMFNRSALRSQTARLRKDLRRDVLSDAEKVVHETGEEFRQEVVKFIVENRVIRTGRLLRSFSTLNAVRKLRRRAVVFTTVPYAVYADFYRGFFKNRDGRRVPLADRMLRGRNLNVLIKRAAERAGLRRRR